MVPDWAKFESWKKRWRSRADPPATSSEAERPEEDAPSEGTPPPSDCPTRCEHDRNTEGSPDDGRRRFRRRVIALLNAGLWLIWYVMSDPLADAVRDFLFPAGPM